MTLREVPIDALRSFGERVYRHAGMPEEDARTVVEVQLTADLRGVDTHGFQRLPWYADRLLEGSNNPRPTLAVLKESAVSVLLDADNALGQLACVRLMERMIPRALDAGLAAGALRNSNDWGAGAYYPTMAAVRGLVCFGTTTSIPTLAPFGSRTRLLGNNPVVLAVPRRSEPPIVLDMALTPVALGKVLRAQAEGTGIPVEWGFLDRDGRPTADPTAALEGIIPAIGGYKGTGLSMMMNVLAGILPGGAHSSGVGVGRRGQFFWAVSPELLGDRDRFLDEVEAMAAEIKGAEPLPGEDEVLLPGEPEQRELERRTARGAVPYPRSVVEALEELGRATGVGFP